MQLASSNPAHHGAWILGHNVSNIDTQPPHPPAAGAHAGGLEPTTHIIRGRMPAKQS
jgi:hypothetical protein